MALIIKSDGSPVKVEPKNGDCFSLEEMQKAVGGLIEVVNLPGKKLMIVNEEGSYNGSDVNNRVIALTRYSYGVLFGDILFINKNQMQ